MTWLRIDPENGWLRGVRRLDSPNQDARPEGVAISLIVVHGISLPPGEYGGGWIDDFFTNRLDARAHPYFEEISERRVSAHLLIRRDGELVQYVPFQRRAWHAGVSDFEGRPACNDFSIGIELEGCVEDAYTDAQYERLADAITCLRGAYPQIAAGNIVGHSDIAPGRKTDPGPGFEWKRLHGLLARGEHP